MVTIKYGLDKIYDLLQRALTQRDNMSKCIGGDRKIVLDEDFNYSDDDIQNSSSSTQLSLK